MMNALTFPNAIAALDWRNPNRRQTPTVLQMEAVECGAAALGIILAYHGLIVPLAELREECGVSRDGSKATNILKAAQHYGIQAKGLKIQDIEDLKTVEAPYIIFWNFNHFLVFEGCSEKRVYLNDPATGPRTVTWEEFDGAYTGVVLLFEPSETFQPGGSKPSLVDSLWSRLRSSTGVLLYCILAGFLMVLPEMATPIFSQIFIDRILVEHRESWIRPLILGLVSVAVLEGIITLLQLKSLRRMKIKLSMGMSSQFIWHILRLPISFYDQRFAGEISSRIQFNDSIASLLSGNLATTIIAAVMVVFYILLMVQYDLLLTVIGVVFMGINLATLQWVSRWRGDANLQQLQEQGKVSGLTISGLQSMETLKASGLESDFFTRWAGQYAKTINAQQTLDVTNQFLGILPTLLTAITSLLVLIVGGFRVMDGALTIGMLVGFQGLMQHFMEPVSHLVNLGKELQTVEGDLTRLDDVLQNPIDPSLLEEGLHPYLSGASHLKGDIEFQNLTFGYSRVAPPLVEDFNLTLKSGQRVALVGGSGSGKSTIAKLLAGLYTPWSGDIFLDGHSVTTIPRPLFTHSVAFVAQDIFLFGGSVIENLTLWNSTIPPVQIERAIEDTAIADVLQALPSGLQSELLEGATNLSGGQRQRLEIARALVNDPAILILDEATSALDPETERIIDHNIRQRNCTCLIVAHRLSTIRDCDEIIVLEQGKVVQRGTHDELKQEDGAYLQLILSEGGELC
jgi:ATP-binding cassette, subfamily C, bacterial